MINVDAVDFSERRPEEVISFFWRSVCINDVVDIFNDPDCHPVLYLYQWP